MKLSLQLNVQWKRTHGKHVFQPSLAIFVAVVAQKQRFSAVGSGPWKVAASYKTLDFHDYNTRFHGYLARVWKRFSRRQVPPTVVMRTCLLALGLALGHGEDSKVQSIKLIIAFCYY